MYMARPFSLAGAGLLALALLLPRGAAATWPNDPCANLPLCTATGDQFIPTITSDGAGGAIVAWYDFRSGATSDILAQRVSALGDVQWTADGVPLCTATGNQDYPAIVSDGAGGAIVAWFDMRSGVGDIYAQRVSADGVVRWTANGVAVCAAPLSQLFPAIVSDGVGGAIVTWHDSRSGPYDIYVQRISAGGVIQWMANGVALCTATGYQTYPTIASDGAGGAIITWCDGRSGIGDIYAQRISAGGAVQWTADGVALCAATGDQAYPTVTSDGAGGAVVTWNDYRSDTTSNIYAQRISAGGTVQWTANGVALCTAPRDQRYPTITSDGTGGAIATWEDQRVSGDWDIFAQRVSATGTVQWTANGVALCTAPTNQERPIIISDGWTGAIATWRSDGSQIYAQRMSADGTLDWPAGGVAVCTAIGAKGVPALTSDSAGGTIVTWWDYRSSAGDIYAQRVLADGELGDTRVDVPSGAGLAFALDPVRPNPTRGGPLTVRFALASDAAASLELHDVAGRRITSREVGSLGPGQHSLDLGAGHRLAPGLYLVRLRRGTDVRVTRAVVLK
jgi:predicted lipoprotein with Yx(FWY)xxD motif